MPLLNLNLDRQDVVRTLVEEAGGSFRERKARSLLPRSRVGRRPLISSLPSTSEVPALYGGPS